MLVCKGLFPATCNIWLAHPYLPWRDNFYETKNQNHMKQTTKIIVAAVVVVFLAAAFVGIRALAAGIHAVNQSQAIVQVLHQRDAKAARLRGAGVLGIRQALRDLASELDAIDVSQCPMDFKLAWFNYVQEVHSEAQIGIFGLSQEAEKAKAQLQSCDRVAIKYGVSFVPRNPD
jgi:hypothetical protein